MNITKKRTKDSVYFSSQRSNLTIAILPILFERASQGYDVFGSVLPDRNYTSSISYRYRYQGKEVDTETGYIDFMLRQYDTRIGRWFNPDPMHQYYSPYVAMGNNPVSVVDPTGGEGEDDVWVDQNGNPVTFNLPEIPTSGDPYGLLSGPHGHFFTNDFWGTGNFNPLNYPNFQHEYTAEEWAAIKLENFNRDYKSVVAYYDRRAMELWQKQEAQARMENFSANFEIALGLVGATLDEMSKTEASVGIFTQRINVGYYPKGWTGNQYVNTFKIGIGVGNISTAVSVIATGKAYWDIAHGNKDMLTYRCSSWYDRVWRKSVYIF